VQVDVDTWANANIGFACVCTLRLWASRGFGAREDARILAADPWLPKPRDASFGLGVN
jgi:hypothetical protein